MNITQIAKITHEINRAYCESIGEDQPAWDEAPQWQKDSAIAGVHAHLANPDMSPRDSHNAWLEHKKADGWTYAPQKNASLKTHPCFVPYEQLSQTQRSKDYLFKAVVHALNDIGD
jgi:hypothetical protein